jgi:hypothetical protein
MTQHVHDSHLSHSSALRQRMKVPQPFKDNAISVQEVNPGTGWVLCAYMKMIGSERDARACARTCLGVLHHSDNDMQYCHIVSVAEQAAKGTEFSLHTLTFIPFIHPSFTHLH